MAHRFAPLLALLIPIGVQAQGWNWVTPFLGAGSTRIDDVTPLADGGTLTCGAFNDTLITATDTFITHGGWDAFVARLDDGGAIQWLVQVGGTYDDQVNEVAVDDQGQCFAAAALYGAVLWGDTEIAGTGMGATLVRFTLDGTLTWYRRAVGNSYGYNVAVGPQGIAYLGGVLNDEAVFSGTQIANGSGIYNMFLVRYTADAGTLVSANVVSGSSGDYGAYDMDLDAAGNVFATGYTRPGPNPYVGSFMRKIAFDGSDNWGYSVSSAFGDMYGYGVSATHDGHVYFTGSIYNDISFVGQPLGHYGRYNDAYLARFDAAGTLEWVKNVGFTAQDIGIGVVADGLGDAYWTGTFHRQADFDTVHVDAYMDYNSQDIFVAHTLASDTTTFVNTAGGYNDERGTVIGKRVGGPVIVGGRLLSGQSFFGPLTVQAPYGTWGFVASMTGAADDLATDVPEPTAPIGLSLFPVPADDRLRFGATGLRGTVRMDVYDNAGRIVLARSSTPLGEVDVRALPAGLYTLRCADAYGHVCAARFVKQ